MRSFRARTFSLLLVAPLVIFATLAHAPRADAQDPQPEEWAGGWDEPWFFAADLGVTGPLNEPLSEGFGVGGEGSVSVHRSVVPALAVGFRLRLGLLSEGEALPQDTLDRGLLDYQMLMANVRLRPLAFFMDDERRATGLILEASVGASLLGGELVPAFATALGWGFALGDVSIGPKIRFTHFVETHDRFGGNDAFTLTGAIEVAFLDRAAPTAAAVSGLENE